MAGGGGGGLAVAPAAVDPGLMTEVTVVEVPWWRGSGAATAERLVEGARLLAGMVPAGRRVRVEVDDDLVVTASRVRRRWRRWTASW